VGRSKTSRSSDRNERCVNPFAGRATKAWYGSANTQLWKRVGNSPQASSPSESPLVDHLWLRESGSLQHCGKRTRGASLTRLMCLLSRSNSRCSTLLHSRKRTVEVRYSHQSRRARRKRSPTRQASEHDGGGQVGRDRRLPLRHKPLVRNPGPSLRLCLLLATLHTYAIICLGTAPFVLRLMLSLTATYTAIISDAYIGRRSPAIIGLTTKPWPPTLPQ
jgi:hypothetical protein